NVFSVSGLKRNRGAEFVVFGEAAPGVWLLGGVTFISAELAKYAGAPVQRKHRSRYPGRRGQSLR
uniref:hypothetical protein n=1 Tax=Escherichia coli TaxID=562 RepID=UPI0013D3ED4B